MHFVFNEVLSCQQGSLFVFEGEEYLTLASSYGQAILEAEITQHKEVPKGYTHVTSGFG